MINNGSLKCSFWVFTSYLTVFSWTECECITGSKQRTQYDIRRSIEVFFFLIIDLIPCGCSTTKPDGGCGWRVWGGACGGVGWEYSYKGILIDHDIVPVRWRSTTLKCQFMWWLTASRRTKLTSKTVWGFTTCTTTSTRRWKVRARHIDD